MQQLRLFFVMALLYMFRVTIPPIIRSTMLYMAFQVGRYTGLLASISGILSHFYMTPASHQPNPLGFSQRYIVALLHDSRFASAKSLGQLSVVCCCISKRYSFRVSHTSWVSTSGTLPRLYTATTFQLDFFGYLSGTPPHS